MWRVRNRSFGIGKGGGFHNAPMQFHATFPITPFAAWIPRALALAAVGALAGSPGGSAHGVRQGAAPSCAWMAEGHWTQQGRGAPPTRRPRYEHARVAPAVA
jgi:hypothetical protein